MKDEKTPGYSTEDIKGLEKAICQLICSISTLEQEIKISLLKTNEMEEAVKSFTSEEVKNLFASINKVDQSFCDKYRADFKKMVRLSYINVILILVIGLGGGVYFGKEFYGRAGKSYDRRFVEEGRISCNSKFVDVGTGHKQRYDLPSEIENESGKSGSGTYRFTNRKTF